MNVDLPVVATAKHLALFLMPRDRWCIGAFCLARDDKSENELRGDGVYMAYSVGSPYMPYFGYPVTILEPADMRPVSAEKGADDRPPSRWQFANLAALVKETYGRSGVFAIAFFTTPPQPPKQRVRLSLPRTPPRRLTPPQLRLLTAARLVTLVLKSRQRGYVYFVNGAEEYERPEEVALSVKKDPTSVYEVAYVDSRIAVYAASVAFLFTSTYAH